jgi:hypothetical protein
MYALRRLFTDKMHIPESLDVAKDLCGKRLVDFPERDIIEFQPLSRQ